MTESAAPDGAPARRLRTMEDFASAAGVSRPTVSKLFQDPDSVRPASRERIQKAMEEFAYHPNLFAVNFNRKSTRTIGIVVPSLSDPFYAEIVRRVELGAIDAGYWSIVLSSHADTRLEARALQVLESIKVAGTLIAPLGECAAVRGDGAGTPVVLFDSRMDSSARFVGTDNAQSFELLVEYLCRTGEPPCLVAMPDMNSNARERRAAFCAAMRQRGLAPAVLDTSRRDWAFEEIGFEVAMRAVEAGGFPSATVLCANDRLAFGVMAAATQRGLRIGRGPEHDLRVAGHDDHPLSRYSCPSLTTAAQDYEGIARAALADLLAQIGPEGSHGADLQDGRFFDAKLVMRASA